MPYFPRGSEVRQAPSQPPPPLARRLRPRRRQACQCSHSFPFFFFFFFFLSIINPSLSFTPPPPYCWCFQVDLEGGYYDAGDNVKYGLPMAFTVTTLAWAALAYPAETQAAGEMENLKAAIQWGTDYLLKASSRRNRFYVEVCMNFE